MKSLLVLVITTILATSCNRQQGDHTKTSIASVETQRNDLPAMRLTFPDGKKTTARELGGNIVLVIFQPDCDHCQREAEQISKFSESFSNYKVYFITSAAMNEIVTFGEKYQVSGKPNFFLAQTPVADVINNFGSIETPSLYIYSKDNRLVQSFNGEVAIEVVVKYL